MTERRNETVLLSFGGSDGIPRSFGLLGTCQRVSLRLRNAERRTRKVRQAREDAAMFAIEVAVFVMRHDPQRTPRLGQARDRHNELLGDFLCYTMRGMETGASDRQITAGY
ncbi:hypothetical protein [Paraburkholderia terrae]